MLTGNREIEMNTDEEYPSEMNTKIRYTIEQRVNRFEKELTKAIEVLLDENKSFEHHDMQTLIGSIEMYGDD